MVRSFVSLSFTQNPCAAPRLWAQHCHGAAEFLQEYLQLGVLLSPKHKGGPQVRSCSIWSSLEHGNHQEVWLNNGWQGNEENLTWSYRICICKSRTERNHGRKWASESPCKWCFAALPTSTRMTAALPIFVTALNVPRPAREHCWGERPNVDANFASFCYGSRSPAFDDFHGTFGCETRWNPTIFPRRSNSVSDLRLKRGKYTLDSDTLQQSPPSCTFSFLSTSASCEVDSQEVFSPTSRGNWPATSSNNAWNCFLSPVTEVVACQKSCERRAANICKQFGRGQIGISAEARSKPG